MNEQARNTDRVRMIAQEATRQQSEICTAKMGSVEKELSGLSGKFDKFADKMSAQVSGLTTGVAVLRTRWQLFAIAGGIIGVTGTLIGILVAIFK